MSLTDLAVSGYIAESGYTDHVYPVEEHGCWLANAFYGIGVNTLYLRSSPAAYCYWHFVYLRVMGLVVRSSLAWWELGWKNDGELARTVEFEKRLEEGDLFTNLNTQNSVPQRPLASLV